MFVNLQNTKNHNRKNNDIIHSNRFFCERYRVKIKVSFRKLKKKNYL